MKIIVDLFSQHSGDIKELKRMALSAHLAGADAVKLQLLNSQRIWGDGSRKNLEFTFDQTKDVFDYSIISLSKNNGFYYPSSICGGSKSIPSFDNCAIIYLNNNTVIIKNYQTIEREL